MPSKPSLRVLFYPVDAVGHVNSAIGIAQQLLAAGHRPVFFISPHWRGKMTQYGFDEIVYDMPGTSDPANDSNPAKYWALKLMEEGCMAPGATALSKMIDVKTTRCQEFHNEIARVDQLLTSTIKTIKPDLIVLDQILTVPAVELSGIPWVWTCSCNPLFSIYDEFTPPEGSGLSVMGDKNEWKVFKQTLNEASLKTWQHFNDYLTSKGLRPLDNNKFFHPSKYLNIYSFPTELDYTDVRPLPSTYYSFDHFMRNDKQLPFKIPKQLADKPGKLVYFSLGSMGAADVVNMKRLVGILSKSKHRFIVSKGPLHDEFDLPDNMWGEGSVPQIQVLPLVDLVITHGGNNTVAETFYHGKPMIVMPLFVDQYDNAQRVHEKGFGKRLDAYKCSEDELLITIESLLNDKDLNQKLSKIAKRIQTDNNLAKLPQLFEQIVAKKDSNNN